MSAMGHRLLIVDDHAGFRASVRRTLSRRGFDVVGEAGDGAEAVDMAGSLRPDVMLVDLGLPDFDGFEVAARVRDLGIDTIVVLTSSRDWYDLTEQVAEVGAAGFVTKTELSGERLLDLVA